MRFIVKKSNEEDVVIEAKENEAFTVSLSHNPYAVKQNNPTTTLTISGNRQLH